MRDSDAKPIIGGDEKPKYVSSLKWSTRELQNGFSAALLALIDDERGFGSPEPTGGAPAPQRRSPAPYRLERPQTSGEPLPSNALDDLWRDDGSAP